MRRRLMRLVSVWSWIARPPATGGFTSCSFRLWSGLLSVIVIFSSQQLRPQLIISFILSADAAVVQGHVFWIASMSSVPCLLQKLLLWVRLPGMSNACKEVRHLMVPELIHDAIRP